MNAGQPLSDSAAERSTFHFERANQLVQASDNSSLELERLLRELNKCLSYKIEDIKFYHLLGKVYRQALDLSSALFCFRFILRMDPNQLMAQKMLISVLTLKGKENMILGAKERDIKRFQHAKACFDEGLVYQKDHDHLWINKCICHVHLQEFTEAFEAINKVIKPHKQHELSAEVYILRAKIYWARGLLEQGNHDIKVAAAIDNEHVEVLNFIQRSFKKAEKLYLRASKKFRDGLLKEALEDVEHALFVSGEDMKLHCLKIRVYRKLGQGRRLRFVLVSSTLTARILCVGDLQAGFDAVMRAKAVYDKMTANHGNVYFSDAPPPLSAPQPPLAMLSAPMQLPKDLLRQLHLILNDMAMQYATDGDYAQAILLYNYIIKNEAAQFKRYVDDVVDFRFYLNRADCYRAVSKLSQALEDYLIALKLIKRKDTQIATKISLTYYLLALQAYNDHDLALAHSYITSAIEHNVQVAEYYHLKGRIAFFQQQHEDAYDNFRAALALQPDNQELKQRLQQYEHGAVDDADAGVAVDGKPIGGGLYRNEPYIARVQPSAADHINTLLHPRRCKALPPLKLLQYGDPRDNANGTKRMNDDVTRRSGTRRIAGTADVERGSGTATTDRTTRAEGTAAEIKLPALKPSYAHNVDLREKASAVVAYYHDKLQIDRSPLWAIVGQAAALAKQKARETEARIAHRGEPSRGVHRQAADLHASRDIGAGGGKAAESWRTSRDAVAKKQR